MDRSAAAGRGVAQFGQAAQLGLELAVPVEADEPSTLYKPYAEVKQTADIFRNHPEIVRTATSSYQRKRRADFARGLV